MNIGSYSYEEYVHLVESFHGSPAPGLLIGGFIVDLALKKLPEGEFFDALCETSTCLPDAVQLLTPCTVGNGWLRILEFGRFAVTLYEKNNGQGVRVYLDTEKLRAWSEINQWYLKVKKKREQDHELLLDQIKEAGYALLSIQRVRVEPEKLRRRKQGPVAVCPGCGEAYPARHGDTCKGCQGESPYVEVVAMEMT
ncbi:MAG: formylmethanofuran dehydrogenase subunit E family protein [Deltaproteobacteria bacterium]|nr:formylmethanofuran dehydrogenase subunit E family protein [Deltaproteobacteria bacterium]